MFCLECGLPVDPSPFDVHKARRKRVGMVERFLRLVLLVNDRPQPAQQRQARR